MSDLANEIILHNYPQSPVAEKVRVILGIKGLSWHSVHIPRIPPKPMLTTLTGGYRRTPVMQIGADIYCDSQRIIQELECRYPSPTIMPTNDAGVMWCASRWTDGAMFDLAVKIVLGAAGDALDPDFAEDRGRLYLGPDWAAGLKKANASLPHLVSQLRGPFSWLNDQLADGRSFLLGPDPAAIDAQMYHVVWFIRGRWEGGPRMLSEFPDLERWEQNVLALGHGTVSELPAERAIVIARDAEPQSDSGVDGSDPQGIEVGSEIRISPDVDGGEQDTEGEVQYASAQQLSIVRESEDAGTVCVHFPRTGYRVALR